MWRSALGLRAKMKESALKPDVITLNAAMITGEKDVLWRNALGMLVEMEESLGKPDLINLSAVMSACEKGVVWTTPHGPLQRHGGADGDSTKCGSCSTCCRDEAASRAEHAV